MCPNKIFVNQNFFEVLKAASKKNKFIEFIEPFLCKHFYRSILLYNLWKLELTFLIIKIFALTVIIEFMLCKSE